MPGRWDTHPMKGPALGLWLPSSSSVSHGLSFFPLWVCAVGVVCAVGLVVMVHSWLDLQLTHPVPVKSVGLLTSELDWGSCRLEMQNRVWKLHTGGRTCKNRHRPFHINMIDINQSIT